MKEDKNLIIFVIIMTLSFFIFYLYFTKLEYKKKERQRNILMVKVFDEIHQEVSANREVDYSPFLLSISNYFSRSLLDEQRRFYIELEHIKSLYPTVYSLLRQLEELKNKRS